MRFFRPYRFWYISGRTVVGLIAIVFILIFIWILNVRFIYLAKDIAQSRAQYLTLHAINETIKECFQNGGGYEQLIVMQKDSNGSIMAVNTDITKLNSLKSIISTGVTERMNDMDTAQIMVPVSNLLGISVFSAVGPKIQMRVVPLPDVQIDFEDQFTSAGINQTKLEIMLKVKVNLSILMPAMRSGATVATTVPVAQTILLGNVPSQYTNIETKAPGGEEALNLAN